MLPTFFLIGAGQSGTTSMHHYLGLHPEVQMSAVKEPHFFARAEDGPWPFGRIGDRAAYEALFDSDAPVRGESSPSYSQHPLRADVPERIAALVPEARFLYLVRDPIDRILAHYVHDVHSIGERRPLREALGDLDDPRNPFLAGSSYAMQIERYREVFAPERLLVVDAHRLRSEPHPTLAEAFAFLGVDPGFTSPGFSRRFNVGGAKRIHNPRYARLRDSRLGDAWRRGVPARLRDPAAALVRRAVSRPVPRPELETDLRAPLEARLRPEVERLRELTGWPLADWSL